MSQVELKAGISEATVAVDSRKPLLPERPFDKNQLPSLYRDRGFWGMIWTQFLGAFNDNLFKQLVLLLAIPVGASAAAQEDQQGDATIVFALAFILFSGFAGFLSDRFSKRRIIVPSKIAEVLVMALGLFAFWAYDAIGMTGLLIVLFLMGTQSAFFGPGKYGILPEMLRQEDLPRANGLMMMMTFLAIIFGTAIAGVLKEAIPREQLWMGSFVCITIAVLGTITAMLIRRVPASKPNLRFTFTAMSVPLESRRVLKNDRPLFWAIFASSIFWMVGGIAIQAVNRFGVTQLGVGDLRTSLLTATIGVGIAFGSIVVGRLCQGRPDPRFVKLGLWGIVASLLILGISRPDGVHLLQFSGSLPFLVLLGASAAFFAVPVQVFLQSRPPDGLKGRMIAVMNQANFVAIMLSGLVYKFFDSVVVSRGWPRSAVFAMMALMTLPIAIFYRLDSAEKRITPRRCLNDGIESDHGTVLSQTKRA